MSSQADRMRSIMNLYNATIAGFEKKCGLSGGAIYLPIRRESNFSEATIEKVSFYTPFNRQWIKEGEGDVFKDELSFFDHMLKILYEEKSDIRSFEKRNGNIPGTFKNALKKKMRYGDMVLWAEDLKGIYPNHDYSWIYNSEVKQKSPEDRIPSKHEEAFPKANNEIIAAFEKMFPDCDGLITVNNDAMSPSLMIGDIVVCKQIDPQRVWMWNSIYFISTENGTLIRRVRKGDSENSILCIADNSEYEPILLYTSEISSASLLLGKISAKV